MPNQFLSPEGDLETFNYFVTEYWLIDQYIGDKLFVWGPNSFGALGNNTSSNDGGSVYPVTTFAGGTNWKQVSAAGQHTAAIKTDGTLWVWGSNSYAQLGGNTSVSRSTPVTTFAGGTNWKQVSAAGSSVAAIKTDGTLWTWGRAIDGQLGNNLGRPGVGIGVARSTPVTTFAGGTNWKQVSCGSNDSVAAIKTDGTLWVWGRNYNGQLGNNEGKSGFTALSRSTPVTTFAGGTNWKQVSGGDYHTVAVTSGTDPTYFIA